MEKIVSFGECLYDKMYKNGQELKQVAGGAPMNTALIAAQLGAHTTFISAVGSDMLGNQLVELLRERGIDFHILRTSHTHPTGSVRIDLDETNSAKEYTIYEGVAYDFIECTPGMAQAATEAQIFCFGSLAQRAPVSRKTLHHLLDLAPEECIRAFDVNFRQNYYSQEVVETSVRKSNVLKLNETELPALVKMILPEATALSITEQCHAILEKFPTLNTILFTCGEHGSWVFSTEESPHYLSSPKVEVVDTVGAGDAFFSAFLVSRAQGLSIAEAHKVAVSISSEVCTHQGGQPILASLRNHLGAE